MRTSNPDRLTAATAEQLLDGGLGPAGLTRLLAAAAGPGTASELAGETAARAAFVDAPRAIPHSSAQVRRPSMLSTALSKILAAKALAAVVLLAGAGGGVALAANTSGSGSSSGETAVSATATADPQPAADGDLADVDANVDADADVDADVGSDETAAEPEATKVPSPEPSITGLCRAWTAGATDNPGAAADNPAFRSLVDAAGSEEEVPGFCAGRDRTDQPGRSGAAPGHADDDPDAITDDAGSLAGRSDPPTVAPGKADHPAGPPAERATRGGVVGDDDDGDDDDSEADSGGGRDDVERGGQGDSASGGRRSAG